jgi:hypothetical protein
MGSASRARNDHREVRREEVGGRRETKKGTGRAIKEVREKERTEKGNKKRTVN